MGILSRIGRALERLFEEELREAAEHAAERAAEVAEHALETAARGLARTFTKIKSELSSISEDALTRFLRRLEEKGMLEGLEKVAPKLGLSSGEEAAAVLAALSEAAAKGDEEALIELKRMIHLGEGKLVKKPLSFEERKLLYETLREWANTMGSINRRKMLKILLSGPVPALAYLGYLSYENQPSVLERRGEEFKRRLKMLEDMFAQKLYAEYSKYGMDYNTARQVADHVAGMIIAAAINPEERRRLLRFLWKVDPELAKLIEKVGISYPTLYSNIEAAAPFMTGYLDTLWMRKIETVLDYIVKNPDILYKLFSTRLFPPRLIRGVPGTEYILKVQKILKEATQRQPT